MKSRTMFITLGILVVASTSLLAPNSLGQQRWTWPERGKNLKVLPEDSDAQRLRAVMTGFTRALGVRCVHCHVGKEGEPLDTFDFASDENPKKEVARGMLKMLGSINDQLEQIQPDVEDRVNMWCNTCHRGVPHPRTLVEELTLVYDHAGVDSTLAHYRDLRTEFFGAGAYDFREPSLNNMGYHALEKKDLRGAQALLQLNVELFPESANARDSLAEAFLAAGDTTRAISEYEQALKLDPESENAAKMLKLLRP
jgi:tetratricopeptide (TPR) repeat protein